MARRSTRVMGYVALVLVALVVVQSARASQGLPDYAGAGALEAASCCAPSMYIRQQPDSG